MTRTNIGVEDYDADGVDHEEKVGLKDSCQKGGDETANGEYYQGI